MIQIGCQGWNYDDWVTKRDGETIFYPHGTRSGEMLALYAQLLTSVEVDSTFYAVPSAASVEHWAQIVPPDFTFSLKLPRAITHENMLGGGAQNEALLHEFCERARLLQKKLAVILIQLPPQFAPSAENIKALRAFLPILPRDLRFSAEFRHSEWMQSEISELLAGYNVAIALVEGAWIHRRSLWRAAAVSQQLDFAYVRWMGERDLTNFSAVVRPQDENLQKWAAALETLQEKGRDVCAYFSNYYEGHAPASVVKLKRLLGQKISDADDLNDQPSLF